MRRATASILIVRSHCPSEVKRGAKCKLDFSEFTECKRHAFDVELVSVHLRWLQRMLHEERARYSSAKDCCGRNVNTCRAAINVLQLQLERKVDPSLDLMTNVAGCFLLECVICVQNSLIRFRDPNESTYTCRHGSRLQRWGFSGRLQKGATCRPTQCLQCALNYTVEPNLSLPCPTWSGLDPKSAQNAASKPQKRLR